MRPRTTVALELNDALELAELIRNRAKNDGGKPVAICVVNAAGVQLCAVTMDGTKAPSISNAHNKAVTAVRYERDTISFGHMRAGNRWTTDERDTPLSVEDNRWSAIDIANAMQASPTFCSWAGGVLITSPHSGDILGAVGVSNREEIDDHELASLRPSGWSA